MGTAAVTIAGKLWYRAAPYTVLMKAVQQQCCTLGRVRPARFGLTPEVDMDRSARLFLCARCRDKVLLCSHCDRGQHYCGPACSRISRNKRRREAAERYQDSRRGRLKHAARSASWRERRRSLCQLDVLGGADKVTHQGSPDGGAEASLLACDTPSACAAIVLIGSVHDTTPAGAGEAPLELPSAAPSALPSVVSSAVPSATPSAASFAALVCRRCARPLLPHVRLAYLRASGVRRRRAHDHPC